MCITALNWFCNILLCLDRKHYIMFSLNSFEEEYTGLNTNQISVSILLLANILFFPFASNQFIEYKNGG